MEVKEMKGYYTNSCYVGGIPNTNKPGGRWNFFPTEKEYQEAYIFETMDENERQAIIQQEYDQMQEFIRKSTQAS